MVKPDYTLIDHVRWMGTSTFEEKPFCEADALVLCEVVYFEIFGSAASSEKTLRELIESAPIHNSSIVKCLGGGTKAHPVFIQAVADSRRYGEIRVKSFAETLDLENSIQFAAITYSYRDLFNFIAFRGTDDTIAGWKEDFMISFTKTTAQQLALEYAEANLPAESTNYIGGHSKGGNLALYAASMLPDELRERLNHVFDLDGPGFCPEVFDLTALDKIQEKVSFIIPEFSVIGKIFEPDIHDKKIVSSGETAIMQHELLSWGVTQNGLHTIQDNDPGAKKINRVIDEWVENIPQSDRKIFVSDLFDALEKDGAKTMSDLMKTGPDGFEKVLFRVAGISETSKRAAAGLPIQVIFGNLLLEFSQKGFWKFLATNNLIHSLLQIAIGSWSILVPESLMDTITTVLFTGLTAIQVCITIRRLIENNWKLKPVAERLQFCVILIILTLCLFVKRAVIMFGSVIFLVIAFLTALYSGIKAKDKSHPIHTRLLSGLECLAAGFYGFSFLVISQEHIRSYAAGVGICLIADGLVRILFEVLESIHILKPSSGKYSYRDEAADPDPISGDK